MAWHEDDDPSEIHRKTTAKKEKRNKHKIKDPDKQQDLFINK